MIWTSDKGIMTTTGNNSSLICKELSEISYSVGQDANLACWQGWALAGLNVVGPGGLPDQESVNPHTPLPWLQVDSKWKKEISSNLRK